VEVPLLLERTCAPLEQTGWACFDACAAPCVKNGATNIYGRHVMTFNSSEQACVARCADSCTTSTLSEEAAAVFATAVVHKAKFAYAAKAAYGPSVYEAVAREPLLLTFVALQSLHEQCSQCPASLRPGLSYLTQAEFETLNSVGMSPFDYVALLLASIIVSLTVWREVRDIFIGEAMTRQLLRRAAADQEQAPQSKLLVRYAIGFITWLRRYVIMTLVLDTVVLMVLRFGGDTVNVMLNTVATLFMLELDNLAFDFGLSVVTKQAINDNWHVTIHGQNMHTLNMLRRYHVIVLTVLILVLVGVVPKHIALAEYRSHYIGVAFICAIAVGEAIELKRLAYRRGWPYVPAGECLTFQNSGNVQRVLCFVLKVGLAIFIKLIVGDGQWVFSAYSFLD